MRCLPAALIAVTLGAVAPAATTVQAQSPAAPQSSEACREQGVVMFSTSWCGYCRKARAFFEANNIAFEEIDAERTRSEGIRATYKRYGVPYIVVGGEQVRGFNERRLRQLLCVPL